MDILFEIGYCVVDLTNYILAYRFFFGGKLKKEWKKYAVCYSVLIVLQLVNLSYFNLNKDPVDIICGVVMIMLLSDDKIIRSIMLFVDSVIVSYLSVTFVLYCICLIFEKEQIQIKQNPIFNMIVNSTFLFLLMIYLIYKKLTKRAEKSLIQFSDKEQIVLTIALFCCVLIISLSQIFAILSDMPSVIKNTFGMLLSLLSIFFVIVLIWLTNSIRARDMYLHQREISEIRILEQEKRFTFIKKSDEEIRRFRHDVKGHMIVLNNYLSLKDYNGAEEYLSKMGARLDTDGSGSYVGIVAVDAVIDNYKREMLSKNIEFKWDGRVDLSERGIDIFDLCTIFENILVNAIEACESLKDNKKVHISVNIINNKICVIEKNTMTGNLLFDNEGELVTTKEDKKNHGLGTKNIRDAVNKYSGMIKYSCENGWFELMLHI